MKLFISFFFNISILLFFNHGLTEAQGMPFTRGVNLTDWFQTTSVQSIQFSKYTKQDFNDIKSLGCDAIRLPVNIHEMTLGAPEYKIDPLLYFFLDQVVDWAEDLEMNLIIDNHSFNSTVNTDPYIGEILKPIWQQLAEHYKNRSQLIFYEIFNEPHGINDSIWNSIQLSVINTIREVDSVHSIIIGPADWNNYKNLDLMPQYSDNNLIYTFHFYEPFLFTHQGAGWTNPPMTDLKDVPFPFSQSQMPIFPTSLKETWVESIFNNYESDGTEQRIKQLIDIAASFRDTRNVKLFCGEFGVYSPNSNYENRNYWHELVRKYFEEKKISWTLFEYQGKFGIFENGSNELFNHDLNIPLIKALGLSEVGQSDFIISADSSGFGFYDDFIEMGISEYNYSTGAQLNYYNNENPADGSYCISWENAEQYDNFGFDFDPNRDLSFLVNDLGLSIRLYLKVNNIDAKFDIRFVDTKKETEDDHPWRMSYTVDKATVSINNEWTLIDIPLSDFVEVGTWDNDTWYNPIGKFDWQAVDKLEISAEHGNLSGSNILFDKIEIINPNETPDQKKK